MSNPQIVKVAGVFSSCFWMGLSSVVGEGFERVTRLLVAEVAWDWLTGGLKRVWKSVELVIGSMELFGGFELFCGVGLFGIAGLFCGVGLKGGWFRELGDGLEVFPVYICGG